MVYVCAYIHTYIHIQGKRTSFALLVRIWIASGLKQERPSLPVLLSVSELRSRDQPLVTLCSQASCLNPPLNHVVQKAPVVDLPFGWFVFPWLLQSPHHVTGCGGDKSKEVAIPQDAPIQPGLHSRWHGWLHGCRRDEKKHTK